MDNQINTTEQKQTEYQNAYITLLYIQAQGLGSILRGIKEVLVNQNDLTIEEINHWHDYGLKLCAEIEEITTTGNLLIDCVRLEAKALEIQAQSELLIKAANAYLN